ncbi:undecaprenyl-diphosphate phosphatase [Kineococcus glutinatus]|uniref:Undecaprenyl-diphosphatase n=1 Tax=Kineococcus glutinatus TaxID=1070872 RepID=A0ABP9HTU7_9ACTN
MDILQAVVLGVVEGVTEFLPVSSTGHLTITEKLLGLQVDDRGVTAFTAVIQFGAILSVVYYFRSDIARLLTAWVRGLTDRDARTSFDYRFAWYVIAGSIPIGLVGFFGQDLVAGPLRSLWVVAGGLVLWSGVMLFAEKRGTQKRTEQDLTLRDVVLVGLAQCIALVPGVSRSGATISAGLLLGVDRVTATRLSFFLSVPALGAAGVYEAIGASSEISATVGWVPTIVGTVVSFVVAYASVAWLLKFVAHHPITVFIGYRVVVGVLLAVALTAGWITAT